MRLLLLILAAALAASAAAAGGTSEERCVADPVDALVDSIDQLSSPDLIAPALEEAAAETPAEVPGEPADVGSARTLTDIGGEDGRPKNISPVEPPEPCDDG